MKTSLEFSLRNQLHDVVDRIVHALDHAGQDKPRLNHVLVGINPNDKMRGAAGRVFAGLLDRIESPETGIARGGKDHIGAFTDLRERNLFSLSRIVPCRIGDANIILNDLDVRIGRLRALLIAALKTVNESDIHAANKTDSACL